MKGRTPEEYRDGQIQNPGRRALLSVGIKGGTSAILAAVGFKLLETAAWADTGPGKGGIEIAGGLPPFEKGKYQTFPRLVDAVGNIAVFQEIDLGTLGPDVDTIFGIDFSGDISTGALVIHHPGGEVSETRVVGIKRTDLETVQFQPAIGGDRFDIQFMSKFGGDPALDAIARRHARNTARRHQKVVYIGDLGKFQLDWPGEKNFMHAIIRAQRPSRLDIPESNFVNPRVF